MRLTGSPRAHGNSNALADEFTRGAREAGHEVVRFDAALKNVVCVSNMSTNAAIMVRSGFGCMLTIEGSLPYVDPNELALRPLEGLVSTSVLAWKREQPFSPAVTKFIEFVKCFPGIENR